MNDLEYSFEAGGKHYELTMIFVEGTHGKPFLFGEENYKQEINITDFFISKFPVTIALWKHVMNSEGYPGIENNPVRDTSWDDITGSGGFLERINKSQIVVAINKKSTGKTGVIRLPSETEWEYAARGGKYWRDDFKHSGSNNIDEVAWYKNNSNNEVKEVGLKAPNQLGIYEMNGNVWEWCEDCHDFDTNKIPTDGTPLYGEGPDRLLRGGCHHNWAIHCTVSKRYHISRDYKDNCIGFRLALPAMTD
jgi:sulfatase modifying factor 1